MRISGTPGGYLLEPRLWLVLALLLLAEANLCRSSALRDRRTRAWLGWPGAAPLLFLLYVLVTAAWSPDTSAAQRKGYEVSLVLGATLALQSLAARGDGVRVRSSFWAGVTTVTVLLALVALASGLSSKRMAVLGGGPNVFGRLMGLLVIVSIHRVLSERGPAWSRWAWLLSCVFGGALVVLSGSRGALIATAGAVPFCFAVARARAGRLVLTAAAVAAIAMMVISYTDVGATTQRVFGRRIMVLTVQEKHDSGREALYAAAYATGVKHPLFGDGLGSFSALLGPGAGQYPHNILLEVFSECGGLGLALLGITLALYIRGFWRARGHLDAASIGGFALMLCASQFSGDLYDSRGLFLLPVFGVLASAPRAVTRRTGPAPVAVPRWRERPSGAAAQERARQVRHATE